MSEASRMHRLDRWTYEGGRPNRVARLLNRIAAIQYAAGLAPGYCMTLDVRGRRTGRRVSFPVVVAEHGGERYLVAMLGERANWVRNVRTADGRAVLRHRSRTEVRLVEVNPADRAPVLRAYLGRAPGARAHVPVDRHARLEEFEGIAHRFPVFRITRPPADPT
ncbi:MULTISPECIES: nitroreductase/quinone reductase family protein [unclassified Streptomyces]|uniref:nitroreductase/quinone reductase family protein n=1 Tax=unclassified Streptomyces TaxID=2593676 RepID=UPI0036E1136B